MNRRIVPGSAALFAALVGIGFLASGSVIAQESATLALETLNLSGIEQEWGSAQAGLSVDRNSLRIGSESFAHGIGTHAASEFDLDLKGAASRFTASVGVDAETGELGSVVFEVWIDNRKAFDSGTMRGGQAGKKVDIAVAGGQRLRLIVNDAGDGIDHDHADWADASLTLTPGATQKPEAAIAPPTEPTLPIWTYHEDPHPAIHGPRVHGATPGRPFLFRVPATGDGPLRFLARNLPDGLALDPSSGNITGSLTRSGSWVVDLAVTGPKGSARRKLAIIGGYGKLALTPPLGWNSWNSWAGAVDADKVRAAADVFVSSGLASHGYAYVNIDDTWEGRRDEYGVLHTNAKFPDMKGLADYVHAKGLKLGIYSSPGPQTCAGYAGSFGHEFIDAKTWGDWGIDYVKYDWCSYGGVTPSDLRGSHVWPYRLMMRALDAAPRDIVYSLCQYGMSNVSEWGPFVNGNVWRTTGDITDTWNSLSSIGFRQNGLEKYAGPGRWNDPDMLVVGWVGWGPNLHPTRLKPNEQITHISLWSLLAAPMLIGCDLTRLDDFTKSLLLNDEVLEIDQDPLGSQARRIWSGGAHELWARPLFDGTRAVGVFNRDRVGADIRVDFATLGVSGRQSVRDVWLRKSLGGKSGGVTVHVPAHGAMLLKIGTPTTAEYIP